LMLLPLTPLPPL